MRVTGLITQGAKRIGSPEYVKSYKVAYSDDGKTWRTYKVKGKDDDMVRHIGATHPLAYVQQRQSYTHANTHTHAHTAMRGCMCTQSRTGRRT